MPAKQNVAGGCDAEAVNSEVNADSLQAFSSNKSGVGASSSTAQCNSDDIVHDRKWKFRSPPRGLTPNEYVLCHRYAFFESCFFLFSMHFK